MFLSTSLTTIKREKKNWFSIVYRNFRCGGGERNRKHFMYIIYIKSVYVCTQPKIEIVVSRAIPTKRVILYTVCYKDEKKKLKFKQQKKRKEQRKKKHSKKAAIHDWKLCRAHNDCVDQCFSSIHDEKKTIRTASCSVHIELFSFNARATCEFPLTNSTYSIGVSVMFIQSIFGCRHFLLSVLLLLLMLLLFISLVYSTYSFQICMLL